MKYYYKLYFQKANLVIIGMPMSGKSLYSKLISQQYGKQLIDIDQEISIYAEDTIENIFLILLAISGSLE
jgi:shikimate kinase